MYYLYLSLKVSHSLSRFSLPFRCRKLACGAQVHILLCACFLTLTCKLGRFAKRVLSTVAYEQATLSEPLLLSLCVCARSGWCVRSRRRRSYRKTNQFSLLPEWQSLETFLPLLFCERKFDVVVVAAATSNRTCCVWDSPPYPKVGLRQSKKSYFVLL